MSDITKEFLKYVWNDFLTIKITITYKEGLYYTIFIAIINFVNGYRHCKLNLYKHRHNLFYDINILYTRKQRKALKYLL